jgi:t-SNARE complex subunit (syntaxin)
VTRYDAPRVDLQDLATLVNDQSGMVDDISDHIERTADRTRDANVQLRKVRLVKLVPHNLLAAT